MFRYKASRPNVINYNAFSCDVFSYKASRHNVISYNASSCDVFSYKASKRTEQCGFVALASKFMIADVAQSFKDAGWTWVLLSHIWRNSFDKPIEQVLAEQTCFSSNNLE